MRVHFLFAVIACASACSGGADDDADVGAAHYEDHCVVLEDAANAWGLPACGDAAYDDGGGGGGGDVCGDSVCACSEVGTCAYDCAGIGSCCGDDLCGDAEGSTSCPEDCGCGDGTCGDGESIGDCPADCECGNGTCDDGEDESGCPDDCGCGNGSCDGHEDEEACPGDCFCGNESCDPGETAEDCAGDCYCGDETCDDGEDASECPEDCDACDQDGACECGETSETCPGDCGPRCDDDVPADDAIDEDVDPGEDPPADDCGECGDGVLACDEIGRCPEDEGTCDDDDADGEDDPPPGCCGNGAIDGDEACDAGADNGAEGIACTETCELRACGDGVLDEDLGEQCEPAGEGSCSPSCEACWGCDSDEGDTCDDGNDLDGDCCSADGVVEPCCQCDWQESCDGAWQSVCSGLGCVIGQSGGCDGEGSCGNGVLELGEQCDDGNVDADDGCGGCELEAGFSCAQVPALPTFDETCEDECAVTTVCVPDDCDEACACATDACTETSCGDDASLCPAPVEAFVDELDPGAAVTSLFFVPPDHCGDWICEPGAFEDFNTCPTDCWPTCGDGVCAVGSEWYGSCSYDCWWQAPSFPEDPADGLCYLELCDDGVPDANDAWEWAPECGSCACGDHICTDSIETAASCPDDCAEVYPAPVQVGDHGPLPDGGITL